MQRVQQGDLVEVIAGKDKGLRGEVVRVLVKKKSRHCKRGQHHEAPPQSAPGARAGSRSRRKSLSLKRLCTSPM